MMKVNPDRVGKADPVPAMLLPELDDALMVFQALAMEGREVLKPKWRAKALAKAPAKAAAKARRSTS